jgi:hypothetical protein
MMNVEQGISNDEVGSGQFSLLHSAFDIGYPAVRLSSPTQTAEKLQTKGINPETSPLARHIPAKPPP